MRFLVFQHIACEHPGIFCDLMRQDGVAWDAVQLDEGGIIPDFADYDALLVMGGPMDVWQTDSHPWLVAEMAAIEKWVRAGHPYLGFCLGHQLLAAALGGEVGAAKTPEIGILPVHLTGDGKAHWLFGDCPPQFPTLQWHSAEILRAPPGAVVLADSPLCKVNAMAWGAKAVSVQFHIELTKNTVGEWGEVPAYAAALDSALGEGALARLEDSAARRMAEFNKLSEILYRNFAAVCRAA